MMIGDHIYPPDISFLAFSRAWRSRTRFEAYLSSLSMSVGGINKSLKVHPSQ